MTVFYHVSTELSHAGQFTPRVPSVRHGQSEDERTPRVSVGISIEDCLTAIPNGASGLEEMNPERRGYYKVYRIDTDKIGISESDIVTSQTLYEQDLVRDADVTNEHWITVPFQVAPEDAFWIKLIAWDETSVDIVPFTLLEIAEEEFCGDLAEAYGEKYDAALPCSVAIESAVYVHEVAEAGKVIPMYFEDSLEKFAITQYLCEHYRVELTKDAFDEIEFRLLEQSDLRQLFSHHSRYAMVV